MIKCPANTPHPLNIIESTNIKNVFHIHGFIFLNVFQNLLKQLKVTKAPYCNMPMRKYCISALTSFRNKTCPVRIKMGLVRGWKESFPKKEN